MASTTERPGVLWAGYVVARLLELALIGIWVGFAFVATGEQARARYLGLWDLVAGCYLAIGMAVVRQRRERRESVLYPAAAGGWRRALASPRFNFGCVLGASLTGLTSAASVLYYSGKPAADITFAGATAILFAWLLLHAGYARFYAGLCQEAGDSRGPLHFPGTQRPGPVDYLYFSFTIGTSFAVSDVSVLGPGMRWHVMVHTVLSFFYNAILLALAVGILTGR
jgi:uncharacterized membrane protein